MAVAEGSGGARPHSRDRGPRESPPCSSALTKSASGPPQRSRCGAVRRRPVETQHPKGVRTQLYTQLY